MREKDFNQLWEEDGNSNLINSFFLGPQIEQAQKEHIKELVLEKLENEKNTINPSPGDRTNVKNIWGSKLHSSLKTLWWRWQWKLGIPAVAVVIMLFFLGNELLVPQLSFFGYTTENGVQSVKGVRGGMYFDETSKGGDYPNSGSSAESERASSGLNEKQQKPLLSALASAPQATDLMVSGINNIQGIIPPVPTSPPADPNLAKKITHNLNATIQVMNITDTINKLNQDFQQMGGYVVDCQQNGRESGEYGHITAKIPAAKFESYRASILPNIGKILSQSQTANDITNQYYDAQTRLQNWEAEQLRYMEILQQAKTVEDILKVEGALANIRQQIEQLKGQLKLWNNEVDYSTIQIELQSTITSNLKVNDPWQPVSWSKTWKATQDAVLKTISSTWNVFNYGLVGLGYAFPYLILIGIIYMGYRLLKKRKESLSK
ncbi:MAG: DUF4349 domain-containing protein [Desulfitobacteriaceae bacterium]